MPTDILTIINSNFVLIVLSFIGFAAGIFIYRKFVQDSGYKPTSLDERIEDSLRDLLSTIGRGIGTKLIYRLKTLGVVHKQYAFSIQPRQDDDDDGGESKDPQDWFSFNVRPHLQITNPFPAIMWFFTDYIGNVGWFDTIYLVPARFIDRFDQIKISRQCDFAQLGGIYVPRSKQGLEAIKDQATITLYADTVERFSNVIELMNFLDMKFSKDIQSMQKYYELEAGKWESREDQAVESG